jgi:hypothetical protein
VDWLSALQWPAMVVTIAASWFVASSQERRRRIGFWLFILSNAAWVLWGASTGAYALVVLQFGLFAMNVRGAIKVKNAAS